MEAAVLKANSVWAVSAARDRRIQKLKDIVKKQQRLKGEVWNESFTFDVYKDLRWQQAYSSDADTRIVGGCRAGHIPWYVLILHGNGAKCGGALINKFWILSAAHCFCMESLKFHCKEKEGRPRKIVPNYNISEIKVSVYTMQCT